MPRKASPMELCLTEEDRSTLRDLARSRLGACEIAIIYEPLHGHVADDHQPSPVAELNTTVAISTHLQAHTLP